MKSALMAASALLASSVGAQVPDSVQRCRAHQDSATRLACYDAIGSGASGTTTLAPAPPVVRDRPAGSFPESASPAGFGMEHRAHEGRIEHIQTSIRGRFDGWSPRERITLANGQVWQIVDDSSGHMDKVDPKVVVRRGAMGAFYLEIEGTNRSPKVKRVQ